MFDKKLNKKLTFFKLISASTASEFPSTFLTAVNVIGLSIKRMFFVKYVNPSEVTSKPAKRKFKSPT